MFKTRLMEKHIHAKECVYKITLNLTLRFSKIDIHFTCKFPMIMHFMLLLHKCYGSENNCIL